MKKLWVVSVIGIMCLSTVMAQNIVLEQGSTIGIKIKTDRNGTIQNAFATALSAAALIIDNNNPGYLLNVNITITPLNTPNTPNIEFVRIELIANLLDSNKRILLPYTINWREGHFTREGAEERVYRRALMKINEEYKDLLNDIISR